MTMPSRLPASVPGRPHRFRLSRAGIHQVWQYDQTFTFGDGRLLLRGKNGAGKSKALEMLLPFLLDGDPRRIDATGSGKTTLRWLMLDGWTGGTNRLGYLWLEFVRTGEDGQRETRTVGAAIKASTSTGDAKPTYFVTALSAVDDLRLPDPANRPSVERVRELVRPENCYERGPEYRARVARELFGLTDLGRYRNLVHLLHGLRRPTIGDRIEAGELAKVLTEALPPLDDDILDEVARNLDDLDTVRDELARLERTDQALRTFLVDYRGYLRGVLRRRVGMVREALGDLQARRRDAGLAERLLTRHRETEARTQDELTAIERRREEAAAGLRAVRDSPAYRALGALRDRRNTIEAMAATAATAWRAAELAMTGEGGAARRLAEGGDDVGRELGELRATARSVRHQARDSGLDDALVGEPPAAARTVLAASTMDTILALDGHPVEVQRPAAHVIDSAIEGALGSWQARLTAAAPVVRDRKRTADLLDDRLRKAARQQDEAAGLAREVSRIEDDLVTAQQAITDRGTDVLTASTNYADEVRRWTTDATAIVEVAPVLTLVEDTAADDTPTGRALDRDRPRLVHDTAHEVVEPALAVLNGERDAVLTREHDLDRELADLIEDRRRWERQPDPRPPDPPYLAAPRDPRTGAPLYLLVDFTDGVEAAARSGLEAALQAAGLLGGWVCADGTVLAAGTQDVVLRPGTPVTGTSLAEVLRVARPDDCPVSEDTVNRLLAGIGLGESAAPAWVGPDGRWRLGVAHGAHRKSEAEYLGAGARAATRARRLAELAEQITAVTDKRDRAVTDRNAVERQQDELRRALRTLPAGRALIAAWTAYDAASATAARLTDALNTARRTAEQARAAAVRLRAEAEARASADGLPADRESLARQRSALDRLRHDLETTGRDVDRAVDRLRRHLGGLSVWEQARSDRITAEDEYSQARDQLDTARRELATLEETLGVGEQEILARERTAARDLADAEKELSPARRAHQQAHDDVVRAELSRRSATEALTVQEQETASTGGALRRPLGLPGLRLAADLGETDETVNGFDAAQDGPVRERIAALRTLADDIEARLGPARSDVGDAAILRRGEQLRDGLAGGFDAAFDEVDSVKRFELHDDVGVHDVAVVGRRIAVAAEEARHRLSSREQEVFERYLLGELGDHLARQVLAARDLVRAMNTTLNEVRSSHGLGARLVWELPRDADPDIRTALDLLGRPSALRTREQADELRAALRRRIEQARLADPSAGYGAHLRAALDYRNWFGFAVRVTDSARPDRERALTHRTALSQGEQRVVSYVVLFAAAAAHFTSIAQTTSAAPRLILLDDAFAKVDEPTHANLLGLLVTLDLDFVCTSERLWGFFPTVPSLHVYECLRDPARRGVATVHYTWDGHHRRLVSV